MTPRCPSDLALELFLFQPEGSPESGHVAECPSCASRLARMREEGEDFRRFVFPRTVEAVEDAMEKRRFRFHWAFVLAPLGAAAAIALAVMVPSGPPKDYEYGVKGSGMALAVYVNGAQGASAVADGAKVPAGAALRFKVQPSKHDCYLWIASVDATGQVSRLYPPLGKQPECHDGGAVPGGAVLDGQPGPERIFALCAATRHVAWSDVQSAVQAAAAGGSDRVRAARSLGGSLSGAIQASLLLEKQP
jgi:hypothetical protein